jgi:glycosyltransferase involved in cell wall biosynthesis
MIRAVHVITRLTMGGSSENTVATMVALQAAGYDCPLAVGLRESEATVIADARARGLRVVDVPTLGREVAPARDVAAVVALARLFRRERPAVVHTHTSKAGFVGRLAARLARVPAVIHQPHGHIFYGYYSARRTAVFIALERAAARWSDRIVTLTERGTEEHLAHGIGRREQYVAVPSGVPTAAIGARAATRAAARTRLGISRDAFVVAALGRFVSVKGFDVLVAASPNVVAAVPETHLLLIGDGPERPQLERLAAELGVADRLHVTGASSDVWSYLPAADVMAAPSRNEGMGRAIVEALALRIPVVGTAVGGIPAVIVDGECGRVVPPEDPVALADALVALGRDPVLRAKFAAAAVARAEAFSTDVANARMLAVYASLLREKNPALLRDNDASLPWEMSRSLLREKTPSLPREKRAREKRALLREKGAR